MHVVAERTYSSRAYPDFYAMLAEFLASAGCTAVHAACIATIERSALVTTLFTVEGKQIVHVRPEFRNFADLHDGTPPSTPQLILAAEHPLPDMPAFWLNWTKFDYIYILFTEDDAPNPDPARLRLVSDGDRFQLYRIIKSP